MLPRTFHLLRQVTLSPARRLFRARPGSVLILVVALLVLLALMGTAYISTSRVERTTAHQHAADTEVDLLAQGVSNSIKDAVVQDLFDTSTGTYRGAQSLSTNTSTSSTGDYTGYTSDLSQLWLADRIPGLHDDADPYDGNASNAFYDNQGISPTRTQPHALTAPNLAGWSGLSWPLILSNNEFFQFENPLTGTSYILAQPYDPTITNYQVGDVVMTGTRQAPQFWRLINTASGNGGTPGTVGSSWQQVPNPKMFRRFEPTYLSVGKTNYPAFGVWDSGAAGGGAWVGFPTLNAKGQRSPSPLATVLLLNQNPNYFIFGADADGDGIADSLLWKIPVGEIDGITYYAAVRVVDNGAAINVNTAMSVTSDFKADGNRLTVGGVNINTSLFPGNIGLGDLSPAPELFTVTETSNTWTPNTTNVLLGNSPNTYGIYAKASSPNGTGNAPPYSHDDATHPMPDAGPPFRTDFQFMTQADEAYHQLVRRLDNPGQTSTAALNSPTSPFQAYPLSDQVNLASRFCLRGSSGGVYGILESLSPFKELNNNLDVLGFPAIPTQPYDPTTTGLTVGNTPGWYNFNFSYPSTAGSNTPTTAYNLRPLLVTRNPVSVRGPQLIAPSYPVNPLLPAGTKMYDVINPDMLPYDPPVGDPAATYSPGNFIKYLSPTTHQWGVYRCLAAGTTIAAAPPELAEANVNPPFAMPYHQSANWSKESWAPSATRTSINTATFPELWRSFYNVMADQWNIAANTVDLSVTPQVPPAASRPGKAMFKNVIRTRFAGGPAALSDTQVAQLRAAVASVNAMDLRDLDQNITSRKVYLVDDPSAAAGTQRAPVVATVYGAEKQLFITKVVVYCDGANGFYVAIELYNPYVTTQYAGGPNAVGPSIYLDVKPAAAPATDVGLGLRFGWINRAAAQPVLREIPDVANRAAARAALAAALPILPGGRVVLASAAVSPNAGITVPAAPVTIVIPGLEEFVTGGSPSPGVPAGVPGELVLFRTHDVSGTPAAAGVATAPPVHDPAAQYDETVNLQDAVPMDQFDMTGAVMAGTVAGQYNYERPSGPDVAPAVGAPTAYWKCVYPIPPAQAYVCGASGTGGGEVPAAVLPGTPIVFNAETAILTPLPWHQIQINNRDWPAPHLNGAIRVYPYGGFARNGDILMVPYIGSYVLSEIGAVVGNVDEVNTVSLDAVMAEDSDDTAGLLPAKKVYDDPGVAPDVTPTWGIPAREQVGRFCPLTAAPRANWPVWLAPDSDKINPYVWTNRLFDYFTVQAPQDDYFPNADPATYNSGPNPPPITDFPIPVANGTSAANYGEDAIPLHGLININTASWKVLSMLPLVRATNGSVDRVNTDKLARAIVYFRDVDDGSVAGTPHPHGPFKSIFELNQVVDVAGAAPPPVPPGFQNGYNNIDTRYTGRPDDPDGRQGDLVPNDLRPGGAPYPTYATAAPYSPTDGVSGDFKEKFLAMTRISNLITTRSDSFTCYVLVQGWRGVGTPGAALAVQKRAAFILDRSNVGYTLDQSSGQRRLNTLPNVERVPTN